MPRKKDINIEEIIKDLCNNVFNNLGYGLNETLYEKALVEELRECKIFNNVQYEYVIPLEYITKTGKTIQLSTLRLDILIDGQIILELKAVSSPLKKEKDITKHKHYLQALRYGKITGIKNIFLINFGKELEIIKLN